MFLNTRITPYLLAGALLTCAPIAQAKGKPKAAPAPKPPAVTPIKAHNIKEALEILQKTPDGALKAFLAAMVGGNTTAIRQLIMPVSDADFAILTNQKPPDPQTREVMISRIAGMPVRALHVGEVVSLPGNKTLTVGKDDIGDDHVLLQMPNGPLPYLILRVKNVWYVDASSIIAGRKTSLALAKEKEEKEKKGKH
ncbi:MAG: hypothetical protein M3Y28_03500 [Armatimonadota bacterium]|nr:hypothetical protein [Armatimonadota bacterium]